MKPIRFISKGAVVTVHSDFVSVSVTRFVKREDYDNICCFGEVYPKTDGKRFWVTLSRTCSVRDLHDIDSFVQEVINFLYENTPIKVRGYVPITL